MGLVIAIAISNRCYLCYTVAGRSVSNCGSSPIGTFHGNVRVDCIAKVVNSLHYGTNSYAFALNSQGKVIVHPNSALMSTVEKPAPSLLLAIAI
ncbi:hypothetical protein [Nostoc flagelliforme]|uniref:hypothetical protein n=1 Tax=Nostoc flagelliforme TaxID=1306274 RepID=UPI001F548C42|nr:hypothetical protein [Nostoc flagelliforme]